MTKEVPWYDERAGFFGKSYLTEYAPELPPERTIKEVDFIERTLGLVPEIKILDVPCGHGRHSIEFARRGYHVTGQDLSATFLAKARADAKEARVDVEWCRGDMRKIRFKQKFNIVLNLFTAFGYLENDAENERALRAMAEALVPGGKFVIDFLNREWLMRNYKPKAWRDLPDGTVIVEDRQFDFATGRNSERRRWILPSGERKELHLHLRLYTVAELNAMAAHCGLVLESAFGDFDGNELTIDSPRTILIFRRK